MKQAIINLQRKYSIKSSLAQSVERSRRDKRVSGSTLPQIFFLRNLKSFFSSKSWQKTPTFNDFCAIRGRWILNILRNILDKLTKKAYSFAKLFNYLF